VRDEAITVRHRVGTLVPRGCRQHAAQGPPPTRPTGVLVGEGDYHVAEVGIRDGMGEEEAENRVTGDPDERARTTNETRRARAPSGFNDGWLRQATRWA